MASEEWVPTDIWENSKEVIKSHRATDGAGLQNVSEMTLLIARAILAERERCAMVAEKRFSYENMLTNKKGNPYRSGEIAIYAASQIASAIRNPKTK